MTQEEADAVMNEDDKGMPEQGVKDEGGKMQTPLDLGGEAAASAPKAKVRPIQMGDFIFKW